MYIHTYYQKIMAKAAYAVVHAFSFAF